MFNRNIKFFLENWKNRLDRKPLVVRGARQVGKTVAIKKFGDECFDNIIYLNLERPEDLNLFDKNLSISNFIELIQLKFNSVFIPGKTLLFIDEIQVSIVAMKMLRFFYEDFPQFHVIAAGSLLEIKMKNEGFSFPVGRVEFCYMFPLTFDEFLGATGEKKLLEKIKSFQINSDISLPLHKICMEKFCDFLIVGGMPEAVARYADTKSFVALDRIYDSIVTGYLDDVYKYSGAAKAKYVQHVLAHAAENSGTLIKYTNFGNSNYRSREIKEAMDVLERAMIISSVKASYSLKIPLLHNLKKASKLIFFDTGLVNYNLGLREKLIKHENDINSIYRGQLAEQVVGQAMLTIFKNNRLAYWYRDKNGATSEIDFIIQHEQNIIPIEVKSGKTGSLKSLHIFMRESGKKLAFRLYSGELNKQKISYPDKTGNYELISLPFYLLFRIKDFFVSRASKREQP